jgi:predicted DNA-binding transcriptional regulator AlpA
MERGRCMRIPNATDREEASSALGAARKAIEALHDLVEALGPASGEAGSQTPSRRHRDTLLNAREAAQFLGTSAGWLYDHWSELPFTVRLSPRCLRFSLSGLQDWIVKQRRA